MRKTNTLSRQLDYNQKKENNNRQTLFKIKVLKILKIERKDKCWRELEDIKKEIEKEIKEIIENKKKE